MNTFLRKVKLQSWYSMVLHIRRCIVDIYWLYVGSGRKKLARQLSRMNHAEIMSMSVNITTPQARLQVARYLFDLGWLNSAKTVVYGIDLSTYPLSKWPDAGIIISAYGQDDKADELLTEFMIRLPELSLSSINVQQVIDWLMQSGFDTFHKLEKLGYIKDVIARGKDLSARLQLICSLAEYRIRRLGNEEVDIRKYIPDILFSPNENSAIRYFPGYLLLEGYSEHAFELIDGLYDPDDPEDFERTIALLNHFPLRLDITKVFLPIMLSRQVRLLSSLAPIRGLSDGHARLCGQIVTYFLKNYQFKTIKEKNLILRALLANGYHDVAQEIIGRVAPKTDLLAVVAVLRAWESFERQNFVKARVIFEALFIENPHWEEVSTGLRFSLVRNGYSMKSILDFRQMIGVPLKLDDKVGEVVRWSLWQQGDYAKASLIRWNEARWILLCNHYGDKFIRYEIPERAKEATLFFIADSGVGDEIRNFHYYRWLADNFRSVTSTCDPRLEAILRLNFPAINFLPVWRYRLGLIDRLDKLGNRIQGFSGHLFYILTESARSFMDDADFIMSDNFLSYAGHSGLIPPLSQGAVIQASAAEERTKPGQPLRVGVLWRSHFVRKSRRLMYFPYEHLAGLFGSAGVEFHSIQHAMSGEERHFCQQAGLVCRDDIDMYNDFDSLANYLSSFDLVIGISTATTELAASLGIPVWYLGFSPENYWLRTSGGKTEIDQLTVNARVIAPPDINFEEPMEVCIDKVLAEVRRRLDIEVAKRMSN